MVSTMSRWGPVDDIFRSVDGGRTWHSIGERIVLDTSGAPYLDFHGTPKLGWMIGDISIDPFDSDKVMYVTGATIFGTDDVTEAEAGRSTHWSVRAQGLEETAVLDLISPPWGPPLISALGDIGVYRHDRLDVVPPDGQASNPVSGTSPSLDYAAHARGIRRPAGERRTPASGARTRPMPGAVGSRSRASRAGIDPARASRGRRRRTNDRLGAG